MRKTHALRAPNGSSRRFLCGRDAGLMPGVPHDEVTCLDCHAHIDADTTCYVDSERAARVTLLEALRPEPLLPHVLAWGLRGLFVVGIAAGAVSAMVWVTS